MTTDACLRMSKEFGVTATLKQFGEMPRVRLPMSGNFLSRSIEELPLSVRSRNALMRAGLYNVDRLAEFIEENGALVGIRNLGKVSIREVKLALIQEAYEQLTEKEKAEFWRFVLHEA